MKKKRLDPCEYCGKFKAHTPACPGPRVRALLKTMSAAPDRILRLAAPRLDPRHRERFIRALSGEDG